MATIRRSALQPLILNRLMEERRKHKNWATQPAGKVCRARHYFRHANLELRRELVKIRNRTLYLRMRSKFE